MPNEENLIIARQKAKDRKLANKAKIARLLGTGKKSVYDMMAVFRLSRRYLLQLLAEMKESGHVNTDGDNGQRGRGFVAHYWLKGLEQ